MDVEIRVTRPYQGVAGTALHQATAGGRPVEGPRVAIIGWMHGNEPVGGAAIARLEQDLPGALQAGSVLTVHANLDARALDRRHTPGGTDMNRLWDRANLARLAECDQGALNPEEQRVRELAPLLLACDAVLDLHSTSRPAPPFLLFRDDRRHGALAAQLGVRRLITGVHEGAIVPGGLSIQVGLTPGERSDRLGFLFEAGQHRDPKNADRAADVAIRLLGLLGMWARTLPPTRVEGEVYEVVDRFAQAPAGEAQWEFVGVGPDGTATGRRSSPRRLVSFERVEADEVIACRGHQVVRAQAQFTMLMPAPSAEPGADLYFVAQPRFGGLGFRELTDDDARREATAIERMLDLMDDDEFASGTTWTSFEDRVLLDLCADMIGRVLRLPDGHPHRRITVVGRGDWGGDDSERRAGQRYRSAMRRALVDGVPIERIQLLRGASLGWIDSLTSRSTASMLRKRVTGRRGVDLYLSARQPHTLSLLVVGDLDRALREGDTRLVRVAVVVEAANVQPIADHAEVRVVRAGLISGRNAFVRAAWRLRQALVAEHHVLTRRPPLADDLDFQGAVGGDGALHPSDDRQRMHALRRSLRRLQLGLWGAALGAEAFDTGVLDSDGVGRWLAATMGATGIRDVASLRALVVPAKGGGFVADRSVLERALADPDGFAPTPPRHEPAPPQPLCAADVDADDLERWVSWKRFMRRAQVVPHNRGKDIDLTLTGADIHRHLVRLYRRAGELAQAMPGRVMVVVAGDGQSPLRIGPGSSRDSLRAHRAVLRDPHVRYLRIQHAQGTSFAWIKDLVDLVSQRPDGAAPVCLQLEREHGALISVVLLAVRDVDPTGDDDPFSLEAWRLEACGVVVTDFEVSSRDYAVGVFTEPMPGAPDRVNQDLLHYARAHCQGLLGQSSGRDRVFGPDAAAGFEGLLVRQVARWIEDVRGWRDRHSAPPPSDPDGRREWVAEGLGLADPTLVAALAGEIDSSTDALRTARALWEGVVPWPGTDEELDPIAAR